MPATARPAADWRFMLASVWHVIAFGFGSGLARKAPGTWGSMFGWFTFVVIDRALPVFADGRWFALTVLAGFALGVAACGITGRRLGVSDHGAMVWDEILAVWCVLAFLPTRFWWQAAGVAAFRLFDIWKPGPIRALDRRIKGGTLVNGFGVMIDDLLAAAFALLLLAIARRLLSA
ncbi:phosphatidylglycerophosphatase A family protein [Derxia gummosa]|uniref:Phosphatidylglycerophosphatase A n=1 Tax=Derxia gummosa DSM 723 TaxID=1121388 RepID=A0A8B6X1E9_9BURK|nr:phosphatidylglycerophosphatase A [Derxia gummosa]